MYRSMQDVSNNIYIFEWEIYFILSFCHLILNCRGGDFILNFKGPGVTNSLKCTSINNMPTWRVFHSVRVFFLAGGQCNQHTKTAHTNRWTEWKTQWMVNHSMKHNLSINKTNVGIIINMLFVLIDFNKWLTAVHLWKQTTKSVY